MPQQRLLSQKKFPNDSPPPQLPRYRCDNNIIVPHKKQQEKRFYKTYNLMFLNKSTKQAVLLFLQILTDVKTNSLLMSLLPQVLTVLRFIHLSLTMRKKHTLLNTLKRTKFLQPAVQISRVFTIKQFFLLVIVIYQMNVFRSLTPIKHVKEN